jgi:signal transduction histidine kinase
MATIVNHLRDFSRQTKGTYEAVALNEVVAAAFLMLRQQLRIRKIEVVQSLEPSLPAIRGDRFQLEQVFINLIANARDAVQPQGGGRLTVTSRVVGDWVEMAVADTGPGVPVELQDRIFEPFFTTKEVGDGTGLGLSISYGIIREHGGEICVANRPEGGAEFVVRLPVHSPAQPSGNSTEAQNAP